MSRPRALLRTVLVAVLAAGLLAFGGPAGAAGCAVAPLPGAVLSGAEGDLASLGNVARSAAGAAPMTVDGELASIARAHAGRMASAGRIFHNDGYFALIEELDALMLAENVGMGCSAAAIHRAFLASPGHRANLLNPRLTHAGFGAASDASGTLYVVQAFATPAAAPPPPTAPPATPEPPPPPPPTPVATVAVTAPSAPPPTPEPTATPEPTPTLQPTADPTASPERAVLAAGRAGGTLEGTVPASDPVTGGRSAVLAASAAAAFLALGLAWWGRRGLRFPG